jgi:hypothetical protein
LEKNATLSLNREISHMVDIIVRHVDRSKGHNSVNEVLRVSGTRKVQGQKKQGDAGKKRVSSICLQNCVFKPLSIEEPLK